MLCSVASGQQNMTKPEILFIYMGGNDCPPCVSWRQIELPKLEATEIFKSIKFFYVTKTIKSTVPPKFFLPAEIKPLKDQLDEASGGIGGSAQTAVVVNGKVYDYYLGTRSAAQISNMLESITAGTDYPFARCTQRGRDGSCERRS